MVSVYYAMKKPDGLVGKVREQALGGLAALSMKGIYWLAERDCPEVVSKAYEKLEDFYHHCFEK